MMISTLTATKRASILAGLLACVFAGAGCNSNKEAETPTTPAGSTGSAAPANNSGGKTMLAFVTNGPSDYWVLCRKGTEAAEKELGNVDVQFTQPSDSTAATQKSQVDDLIAKGVKGIAISPVDPANMTPDINKWSAQIPVITSDSDAGSSNRLCYIGTDNHAAGVMAGGLIKSTLPQGGKIIIFVGKKDAQNAHDRIAGIQDALKGSNITILDIRTDDADHARAKQNAADALSSTPDLAGMVGIWSYNAPAIYSAVKEAGKQGKVKIIAFDQETATMAGIHDGTISGTVVQQPYLFGKESVEMLAKLAKGDKSGIPANKLILVPTQIVNTANIAKYEADQTKLMGGS